MIDIVLSTHNGSKYLREQLDSILGQSYEDWRLVVRDDASADDTWSILNEYANRYGDKIVLLADRTNMGCIASYELLLGASHAEYISMADQDDVWLPSKLEHAMECMRRQEEEYPGKAIIVCSDLKVVDEQLRILDESFFHYVRLRPDLLQEESQLAVCNYVTGCTMLINRKVIECALPFPKQVYMHDAVMALATLHRGGRIVIDPRRDILYRQHGENVLGAKRVVYNWSYLWSKIKTCRQVIRRQRLNYSQAWAVTGMGKMAFVRHRLVYLLRR